MDFLRLNSDSGSSGQVGVITLLIMAVLLTVGLSTAINTTQDVTLSQQEAESTRVFNAAEAGLEEALSSYTSGDSQGTLTNIADVDVDYSLTEINQLELRLFEGTSVAVDVTGAAAGDALEVTWSREDDCGAANPASILATIFYDDAGTTRARYQGLASCDRSDGFALANSVSVDQYRRQGTVALQPGDIQVRLRPVYADTHLRIAGSGWTLPVQGVQVFSEAKNQLGNETRSVQINRSLPTAPSVMDYALVSGTTIVK